MATTTDLERPRPVTRAAGAGIVVGGDRSNHFKIARRHSILVRALRLVLPLASLAVIGVYGWSLMDKSGLSSGLPQISLPRITPSDLTMQNPHYEGFNKDGGTFAIAAKTAQRELGLANIVKLDGITGEMVDANKSKTNLVAVRGTFNYADKILELFDKIDIVSDNGMKAFLTRATVRADEGVVTSKEPVRVEFPMGSIQALELALRQKVKEVAFVGAVQTRLNPPAPDERTPAQKTQTLFGASHAPVEIASSRLDINDANKTAIFTGNVTASQAGASLQTPEMTVVYAGEAVAGATGGVKPVETQVRQPDTGGKVQRILAKGPVVMTRGPLERVTSQSADFDAENETAVLAGHVVMAAGPDRNATGDQVNLDQRADTVLLTGAVVVTQGLNVLKGRRLFVDRRAGRTQLNSPGGGRISAHFVQSGVRAGQAAAADGDSGGAKGMTFKSNPNAPLDIDANQLDMNDAAKVATFTGDVSAKQGDFVMRAAELQAFYTGSANLADVGGPPGSQAPATANGPGAELTKVKANTKVVMTSTDGRKVTGDWAEFDAKTNKAVVGGDVELHQGKSVVRGTRLLIDMTTGKTTIDTAPAQTVSKPAGGGWVTEAGTESAGKPNSGRPSAIFFPNELKPSQDKKGPAARPAAVEDSSGWTSQTAPGPKSQ